MAAETPRLALVQSAAVVALAMLYAALAFSLGPILTADGYRDIAYAQALIALDYDLPSYLRQAYEITGRAHTIPPVSYLLYIYVLALLQTAFGSGWLLWLLALNVATYAIAAATLLGLVRRICPSAWALLACASALAIVPDGYQWAAMTQSEGMYAAIATAAIVASLAANCAVGKVAVLRWGAVAILLLAAAMTRPTWPPLAGAICLAAILGPAAKRGDVAALLRAWRLTVVVAGLLGAIAILALVAAYQNPALLPIAALRTPMMVWREYLAEGVVVIARPETYLDPLASYWGYLRVILARLIYFFWFTADAFSAVHRTVNIAGHVLLYAAAALGTALVMLGRAGPRAIAAGLVLIGYVLALDFYHAVTILDFDWRYRAPAYPALAFLASLGVVRVRAWVGGPPLTTA